MPFNNLQSTCSLVLEYVAKMFAPESLIAQAREIK